MTAHGGFEVAFHGEYREVIPGARLVSTEVYEGAPDAEALSTVTFTEEEPGRTAVTIRVDHSSPENRDLHLQNGMEDGLQDALDLIDGVIAEFGQRQGER